MLAQRVRAAATAMAVADATFDDTNIVAVVTQFIDVASLPLIRKDILNGIMEPSEQPYNDAIVAAYFLTHPYTTVPPWFADSVPVWLEANRLMAVRAVFRGNTAVALDKIDWSAAILVAATHDLASLRLIWPHTHKDQGAALLHLMATHSTDTLNNYVHWLWSNVVGPRDDTFVNTLPDIIVYAENIGRGANARYLDHLALEHSLTNATFFTKRLRAAGHHPPALALLLRTFTVAIAKLLPTIKLSKIDFTDEALAILIKAFGDKIVFVSANFTFAALIGTATDASLVATMHALDRVAYFERLRTQFTAPEIIQYVRFIALKIKHDDVAGPSVTLAPSPAIARVWHAHMLLPQDYVRMSETLFDTGTLYHNAATHRDANYTARIHKTWLLMHELFGAE